MIILLQLPLMVINSCLGMFIRAHGQPLYFMISTIINLVLNLIFNYIFVKIFNYGVAGIAFSSLISTFIALLFLLSFFKFQSTIFTFKKFRFSKDILKSTILNGSSEFVGQISLAISVLAYNFVIIKYVGINGVSAFAIVSYVSYIFSMILIGFGRGLVSLTSFTYGAKEFKLACQLCKITNFIVLMIGIIVFLMLCITADWYSTLFIQDTLISLMIKRGLIIFAISFIFSGINTITSFYFTSINNALYSAIISFARGLVILLICIFTLPLYFKIDGVWLVAPVCEFLTLFISIYFIKKDRKLY